MVSFSISLSSHLLVRVSVAPARHHMPDLVERRVRSARTARSPVLYLGNKLCLPNVHHLEAGRAGGSPAKAGIALPALHRSEASGLRRPRRGVGERSRDLFG